MEDSLGSKKQLDPRVCFWWRAPSIQCPSDLETIGMCGEPKMASLYLICDTRLQHEFPCFTLKTPSPEDEPRYFGH